MSSKTTQSASLKTPQLRAAIISAVQEGLENINGRQERYAAFYDCFCSFSREEAQSAFSMVDSIFTTAVRSPMENFADMQRKRKRPLEEPLSFDKDRYEQEFQRKFSSIISGQDRPAPHPNKGEAYGPDRAMPLPPAASPSKNNSKHPNKPNLTITISHPFGSSGSLLPNFGSHHHSLDDEFSSFDTLSPSSSYASSGSPTPRSALQMSSMPLSPSFRAVSSHSKDIEHGRHHGNHQSSQLLTDEDQPITNQEFARLIETYHPFRSATNMSTIPTSAAGKSPRGGIAIATSSPRKRPSNSVYGTVLQPLDPDGNRTVKLSSSPSPSSASQSTLPITTTPDDIPTAEPVNAAKASQVNDDGLPSPTLSVHSASTESSASANLAAKKQPAAVPNKTAASKTMAKLTPKHTPKSSRIKLARVESSSDDDDTDDNDEDGLNTTLSPDPSPVRRASTRRAVSITSSSRQKLRITQQKATTGKAVVTPTNTNSGNNTGGMISALTNWLKGTTTTPSPPAPLSDISTNASEPTDPHELKRKESFDQIRANRLSFLDSSLFLDDGDEKPLTLEPEPFTKSQQPQDPASSPHEQSLQAAAAQLPALPSPTISQSSSFSVSSGSSHDTKSSASSSGSMHAHDPSWIQTTHDAYGEDDGSTPENAYRHLSSSVQKSQAMTAAAAFFTPLGSKQTTQKAARQQQAYKQLLNRQGKQHIPSMRDDDKIQTAIAIEEMLTMVTPPSKLQNSCPVLDTEADSDDEVEDIMEDFEVPEWAQSMGNLRELHRKQIKLNTDVLFPPPPPRKIAIPLANGKSKQIEVFDFTCNLDQIFSTFMSKHLRNQRGLPRRSSGNWTRDGLTRAEIVEANDKLGIYVSNPS